MVKSNSQPNDPIGDTITEIIAFVEADQASEFLQKLYRELSKEEFRLVVLGMGCKSSLLKDQKKIVQYNFTCLN